MAPLDLRSVSYRLWRLRRLIGVAALMPLPGILLAEICGRGLQVGGGGGALWGLWILTVLVLAVRFPNGWLDHVGLGLPLAAVFLLSPFAVGVPGGTILGPVLGVALIAAGWVWSVRRLPRVLGAIPHAAGNASFHAPVSLPAKDFRDAMMLRPDAACGLYRCGPADANGLFAVGVLPPSGRASEVAGTDPQVRFFARIAKRDETSQITEVFAEPSGPIASTIHEEITPARSGCLYVRQEVIDGFSVFAALGFWLTDAEADHLTATVDHLKGRRPRALKHLPDESAFDRLAARLAARHRAARPGPA